MHTSAFEITRFIEVERRMAVGDGHSLLPGPVHEEMAASLLNWLMRSAKKTNVCAELAEKLFELDAEIHGDKQRFSM